MSSSFILFIVAPFCLDHTIWALRRRAKNITKYVLLRGLGRVAVFPGDDVGAQNNLKVLLHLKNNPKYQEIIKLTERCYLSAGFVYFHLLLQKSPEKGVA